MGKIYQAHISGVTKDQFYDNTFMSVECKHKYGQSTELIATYHLKKYLIEDMQSLKEVIPTMTFEIV
jgi:hypothetical protein